jgi:hypothetical protein
MSRARGLSSRNYLDLYDRASAQERANVATQQQAAATEQNAAQALADRVMAYQTLAQKQRESERQAGIDERRVAATEGYNQALAGHYTWQQNQPQFMQPGSYLMPDGTERIVAPPPPTELEQAKLNAQIAAEKARAAHYSRQQRGQVENGEEADFSVGAGRRTKFWGDNWNRLVRQVDDELGITMLVNDRREVPPALMERKREMLTQRATSLTESKLEDGTPYLPKNWPYLQQGAETPVPVPVPEFDVIDVETLQEGW